MKKYDAYTDEQLFQLLQRDNEAAFTELYHRYWKLLFSVAANKLESLPDAEEVVQEVFADLWKRRNEIVIRQSVKSFLAGAARFQVYTQLDKQYRREKQSLAIKTDNTMVSPVEDKYDEKELRERLENAAQNLPERCRLVYELSRKEGLTYREIAKKMDISEKTVENQMGKALKHLRTSIKLFFSVLY